MSTTPDPSAPATACPNCGHPFPGAPPRFCPQCGQETRVRPPKLTEFLQQFGGAYLSTEGALWRTLWLLVTKPGELTARYLAGRRKHYVLPLRLYLTISVIVLLVMRLMAQSFVEGEEVAPGKGRAEFSASSRKPASAASDSEKVSVGVSIGGVTADALSQAASEGAASAKQASGVASGAASAAASGAASSATGRRSSPSVTIMGFGDRRAGVKNGQFYCEGFPEWMCQRLRKRLHVDPDALLREVRQMSGRMLNNVGAAMFVMLPAFALWLKLIYWNRRMHYTEHLVFALHLHAFLFLVMALMLPGLDLLTIVALAVTPIYAGLAIRRVYGKGRWYASFLRAAALMLLYITTLAVVMMGVMLFAILF